MKLLQRLSVLGAAIKFVFTNKGVTLTSGVEVSFGPASLSVSAWIKRDDEKWQHGSVVFDYASPPKGYIDGVQLTEEVPVRESGLLYSEVKASHGPLQG